MGSCGDSPPRCACATYKHRRRGKGTPPAPPSLNRKPAGPLHRAGDSTAQFVRRGWRRAATPVRLSWPGASNEADVTRRRRLQAIKVPRSPSRSTRSTGSRKEIPHQRDTGSLFGGPARNTRQAFRSVLGCKTALPHRVKSAGDKFPPAAKAQQPSTAARIRQPRRRQQVR